MRPQSCSPGPTCKNVEVYQNHRLVVQFFIFFKQDNVSHLQRNSHTHRWLKSQLQTGKRSVVIQIKIWFILTAITTLVSSIGNFSCNCKSWGSLLASFGLLCVRSCMNAGVNASSWFWWQHVWARGWARMTWAWFPQDGPHWGLRWAEEWHKHPLCPPQHLLAPLGFVPFHAAKHVFRKAKHPVWWSCGRGEDEGDGTERKWQSHRDIDTNRMMGISVRGGLWYSDGTVGLFCLWTKQVCVWLCFCREDQSRKGLRRGHVGAHTRSPWCLYGLAKETQSNRGKIQTPTDGGWHFSDEFCLDALMFSMERLPEAHSGS